MVFLPYYVRTRDIWSSIVVATPIFTIAMCMFILNDINDIERDRINHPRRPLPTGSITVGKAAVVYLLLFGTSLILVRILIERGVHFIYLAGFLLAINYNTIVNNLPKLKNPYVALTATVPVFIVNSALAAPAIHTSVAIAIFLFVFGREMLMDVHDAPGDGQTLAKSLTTGRAAVIAFILQAMAMGVLGMHLTSSLRTISLGLILLLFIYSAAHWRRPQARLFLIHLMKLQLMAALIFLI
ncbi:MAG TPA: UbiA family prenyltransferase [Allosphingosinicella sp.]|jgi:geranylgeranylglycerol-phosphate geranylgeranyltransferase|nr:UbiA family prenyltransferase [Allosphingosinicella sp.]